MSAQLPRPTARRRGHATLALAVLAVLTAACGSRSERGLMPFPGTGAPSIPALPAPPAAPEAVPLPAPPTGEPADEGARIELPAVPTNLAPSPGARVTVDGQPAPGAYVNAPPLGAAWRLLEDGEGEPLPSCLETGRLRTREVAPNFETRYRYELSPAGADGVRLVVSATVIHRRQSADRARITRGHEKHRRRHGAMPAECGAGYVSRIDFGGRLQKQLIFARGELRRALPAAVPSAIEVGDSPGEVAYLDALVRATFAALQRPPAMFAAVSLRDGRPRREVSPETFDTGPTLEDFTRYAESYRQWPTFTVDLPIQFEIAPYSAR